MFGRIPLDESYSSVGGEENEEDDCEILIPVDEGDSSGGGINEDHHFVGITWDELVDDNDEDTSMAEGGGAPYCPTLTDLIASSVSAGGGGGGMESSGPNEVVEHEPKVKHKPKVRYKQKVQHKPKVDLKPRVQHKSMVRPVLDDTSAAQDEEIRYTQLPKQKLSSNQIKQMSTWFDNNLMDPFPFSGDINEFMSLGALDRDGVVNWFMHARRRTKKEKFRKQVLRFSPVQTDVMDEWMKGNLEHPYPTKPQKNTLAAQTGLNVLQVNSWIVNARKRHYKGRFEQNWKRTSEEQITRANAIP